MAEENIRKKNENKPKDEFGWDEAPVSIRDFESRTVFIVDFRQNMNQRH